MFPLTLKDHGLLVWHFPMDFSPYWTFLSRFKYIYCNIISCRLHFFNEKFADHVDVYQSTD